MAWENFKEIDYTVGALMRKDKDSVTREAKKQEVRPGLGEATSRTVFTSKVTQ